MSVVRVDSGMCHSRLPYVGLHAWSNWAAQGCADLFLATTCPAAILAWVDYADGQVVRVFVADAAGRTTCAVIFTGTPSFPDVLKDAKLRAAGIVRRKDYLRTWPERLRHLQTFDQGMQLRLCEFMQALNVENLGFDIEVCIVEPEPFLARATMDP